MLVIQYLDSIQTLFNFHQVCHSCDDAIGRTKINPCYKERSLETMLLDSRLNNLNKEMKIFRGLETLHIDINSLEKIELNKLERYKLFEIPFFLNQPSANKYKNLNGIKEKIVSYRIDLSFKENLDITTLINLREIRIRVTKQLSKEIIINFITGLKKLRHLHKVIIDCDTQHLEYLWSLVKGMNSERTTIIFRLNWLRDEDIPTIQQVSNVINVGIFTNGLGKFHDIYLKKGVILLFYTDYYLQVSNQMVFDTQFSKLLKEYFPYKIEIQGNNFIAHVGNNKIIKLRSLNYLSDLFINEARFDEKITIELPTHLENLIINNTSCIDRHGLDGIENTLVPKTVLAQFASLI
ncbi:hypothetical protein EHI8A_045240 [Entamoeba histolytica HM-1:IMSS-B]|uniref:Leucine-rich repeat containing protein n=6 Tax=Entamoeba histolytica TaxID=5759 RepID=B1N484_ENTH1|nr:hypothetical protein EHI_058070 [Entamoeba histolytica HM-1:IMSS]EMD46418.1 Hypothetical protein EHI5A_075000 [Entamoeba histolytica KU27]EMH75734.1 hypothetical protein EHI8A_045240 [Entamoeba histolytica HM-1:IMSS-B]EMS13089.1 hypothetical protein KM1_090100 [Entamoeba histolytica HM-3:IMSS]ENY59987.1 hypothetical protein EHI7A_045450 [Entamoeba histolytica HM-1:IMSS-A]EDS89224.1 hypothetical protein EHI_058070 [Entamoeba histolytica HM-1:IMSS]|eukprot:XP_001914000.1 hypothetical protein EHI_058070 [Entamoeba histolytica HM-1:IMSS]